MTSCQVFTCVDNPTLRLAVECPIHGVRIADYCDKHYRAKEQGYAARMMICTTSRTASRDSARTACAQHVTMSEPIRLQENA
jgi:hypothetical protein